MGRADKKAACTLKTEVQAAFLLGLRFGRADDFALVGMHTVSGNSHQWRQTGHPLGRLLLSFAIAA